MAPILYLRRRGRRREIPGGDRGHRKIGGRGLRLGRVSGLALDLGLVLPLGERLPLLGDSNGEVNGSVSPIPSLVALLEDLPAPRLGRIDVQG